MTTSVRAGALLVNRTINDTIEQNFILFGDYRSQGYGAEIIAGIEPFFYGKCGYMVLKSMPLQHDVYQLRILVGPLQNQPIARFDVGGFVFRQVLRE